MRLSEFSKIFISSPGGDPYPVSNPAAGRKVKSTVIKTIMVAASVFTYGALSMRMPLALSAVISGGCAAAAVAGELLREPGHSINWLSGGLPPKKFLQEEGRKYGRRIVILGIALFILGIPTSPMAKRLRLFISRSFKNPFPLVVFFSWQCVIDPIIEEVIFRGFLRDRIEDPFHLWNRLLGSRVVRINLAAVKHISNLAQVIIFGITQRRWPGALYWGGRVGLLHLAFTSLSWGDLKDTRKSLIPSIFSHAIFNTVETAGMLIFG